MQKLILKINGLANNNSDFGKNYEKDMVSDRIFSSRANRPPVRKNKIISLDWKDIYSEEIYTKFKGHLQRNAKNVIRGCSFLFTE